MKWEPVEVLPVSALVGSATAGWLTDPADDEMAHLLLVSFAGECRGAGVCGRGRSPRSEKCWMGVSRECRVVASTGVRSAGAGKDEGDRGS
ncbi:hypothetical protein Ahu01nite_093040 [Winogradskya humida]|uniref:Uncharacterized protein n=1 Tax=Winogradskya humida TaxID=113566 RepID=A0ABQ4A5R7_9ACTN|nr:hypothetical protein Ahu01nite_093040 [Actinoplanes humidus]